MSAMIETRREENRLRETIVMFGRSLFDRGLTAGSSGNISVRLNEGWLLTPTNACLGRLDPGQLSKLDWQGNLLSGDPPSKEAFLHRALYEERGGAGAIVHLHATQSAAVSCMHGRNQADCIPPLTAYFVMKIGRLPLIPYYRPGDPALGDAIRGLAGQHSAVHWRTTAPSCPAPRWRRRSMPPRSWRKRPSCFFCCAIHRHVRSTSSRSKS